MSSSKDYEKIIEEYNQPPLVNQTFLLLDSYKKDLIDDWKAIAKIYSPSGNEILRARYLVKKFQEYGIKNSYIDSTGNAVALLDSGKKGPTIVFLATMDDLKTVAELVKNTEKPIIEKDGKLIGPGTNIGGICVNALGLARMFTMKGIEYTGKIYIVGVTEEETGFTGTKGFIKDHQGEIDYLIDIMGGLGSVSYGAISIRWFKVHFKGPKAHTLTGAGPNVTKGVAKSVTRCFEIELAENCYLNISMLNAGTVFNHRSDDGWHSVDLRSTEAPLVEGLFKKIKQTAEEIAEEEQLEAWIEMVEDTKGGQIPGARHSPLTLVAEEATRILGKEPRISNRGSCNMNAGISEGILSISTGGDRGGNRSYPNEYANIEPIFEGIKLNFLIGYTLSNGKLE
ncbi:M20/M25/M40 family metallo-hydrolase [Candidatus Bathyarchaeota archaeon]|nr:M20/M25/M40 family metallo-hydrolase [Candidatus Bathyarchaeota archaeon]